MKFVHRHPSGTRQPFKVLGSIVWKGPGSLEGLCLLMLC